MALAATGCPGPTHLFAGVSDRKPLDVERAAELDKAARAAWAKGERTQATRLWQDAVVKNHRAPGPYLSLSRAYAVNYVKKGAKPERRKAFCRSGWDVSSKALELLAPEFVSRVEEDNQDWGRALAVVQRPAAEALYWYARYDDCLEPQAGRKSSAMRQVKALDASIGKGASDLWPPAP
ncbi:MAG: hypothetical protein KC613_16420 [Myxococcales bacterium]|nr:hypothetical protein [Myxococcales bacterium]MCB9525438.1 hypothetical protein [Myxococcales bacterium]